MRKEQLLRLFSFGLKRSSGIPEQARASTSGNPRTPDGSPFASRSMTTVRRSGSDRPTTFSRDSLDQMHQTYSGWTE